jgi:hypothetical protein
MTENHPITPPLKLFREWTEYRGTECEDQFWWRIATQAANWGADCELDACCEILRGEFNYHHLVEPLRAARRPKFLSLKEQALALLDDASDRLDAVHENTIRRALEQLDD